jgi:hypothetical protein
MGRKNSNRRLEEANKAYAALRHYIGGDEFDFDFAANSLPNAANILCILVQVYAFRCIKRNQPESLYPYGFAGFPE